MLRDVIGVFLPVRLRDLLPPVIEGASRVEEAHGNLQTYQWHVPRVSPPGYGHYIRAAHVIGDWRYFFYLFNIIRAVARAAADNGDNWSLGVLEVAAIYRGERRGARRLDDRVVVGREPAHGSERLVVANEHGLAPVLLGVLHGALGHVHGRERRRHCRHAGQRHGLAGLQRLVERRRPLGLDDVHGHLVGPPNALEALHDPDVEPAAAAREHNCCGPLALVGADLVSDLRDHCAVARPNKRVVERVAVDRVAVGFLDQFTQVRVGLRDHAAVHNDLGPELLQPLAHPRFRRRRHGNRARDPELDCRLGRRHAGIAAAARVHVRVRAASRLRGHEVRQPARLERAGRLRVLELEQGRLVEVRRVQQRGGKIHAVGDRSVAVYTAWIDSVSG